MKALVLVATATVLLSAAVPYQTTSRVTESAVIRGTNGEILGTEDEADLALGGNFSNPFNTPNRAQATRRRVFEITLTNTGTGWEEPFLLGVPNNTSVTAPLLVVFHGYARTHNSILTDTTYVREAMQRGWYVIAPLGAHKFNYGIGYAQDNVRAVIEWAAGYFPLDLDRVYGVGFSMGGGVVANFAARHQDPFGPRFAAIVNHTGTVSLRNEYFNVNDKSLFENPLMFGGGPNQFPFKYAQASAFDFDSATQLIDPSADMARNLAGIPIKNWAVASDPLGHLVDQLGIFHGHLGVRGAKSALSIGTGIEHAWDTLDESAALDFLEQHVLAELAPNVTHSSTADRDARFYHFNIEQAVAAEFSPFQWNAQPAMNRVYLFGAENIARASIYPPDLGLDPVQRVEVVLNTADGSAVEFVLRGYSQPPSDVTRGGRSTGSWTYDANAETVTLIESSPASYPLWSIQP